MRNSGGVYELPTRKTSSSSFSGGRTTTNQQDTSAPVVLIAALGASDSERSSEVIARLAELSVSAMAWSEDLSDEQIAGIARALAAQNIILR